MLILSERHFSRALEAMMVAVMRVTTEDGLRVMPGIPRLAVPREIPIGDGETFPDFNDWERIRAIGVEALTALAGEPVTIAPEPST